MLPELTTKEALIRFYKFNRLNLIDDFKSHCVRVYIGCILAPVPNIKARKKYIKFHDLHHILAGYGIDRIGESKVSAWELGSRSCRRPIIMIMNLFALSTGFILKPKEVFSAFLRGCRSKNLYYLSDGISLEEIEQLKMEELRKYHLEIKSEVKYKWLRVLEFSAYVWVSMIIHVVMLVMGKAILMAEGLRKRLKTVKVSQ
ncbi:MAG: hypothetical protein ACK40G_12185 [Cytophagaceae bacterium]